MRLVNLINKAFVLTCLLLTITACSNMTKEQQSTVSGAAIGGAAGTGIAALAGGSIGVGLAVGSAVGAAAGNIMETHGKSLD